MRICFSCIYPPYYRTKPVFIVYFFKNHNENKSPFMKRRQLQFSATGAQVGGLFCPGQYVQSSKNQGDK